MKKIKRNKFIFLVAVFLLVAGFFATFVLVSAADNNKEAENSSDDTALQAEVSEKQKKINEIQEDIKRYTSDISRLEEEAATLDVRIKVSENEIQLTELAVQKTALEIEATDSQIEITKQQIEEKERDLQYQKRILANLIRDIRHYDDSTSALALFLKSSTFADILSQERQASNYQNETRETYNKVYSLRDDLIAKERELEDRRQEQSGLKSQLEAQHTEIAKQKADNEKLLADTERSEEKYLELIGEAANQQKQLAQEIQELEREMIQSGADVGGVTGTPVTGSGLLIPPMTGFFDYISQGYGLTSYAQSGVYGYENGQPRIHAGIDSALPCGTSVHSAADGVVVGTSSLKFGFGNVVVVKHDDLNIYTLYGHLGQISAAPGQVVEAGDIIGFEGSTGFSTGCHLHFAVYTAMNWVETSYGRSPWYAPTMTINPSSFF